VGEAQPTPDALAAARAALDRNPRLTEKNDANALLTYLAGMYDRVGPDRFRLLCGLRPPRDLTEQVQVDYLASHVSNQQLAGVLEAEATRAADERMLRTLYDELDERVVAYGRFVVELGLQCRALAARARDRWDESALLPHLTSATARFSLDQGELETACLFVAEVRHARGLGGACVGEARDSTAIQLAMRLTERAERLWALARGVGGGAPLPPDRVFLHLAGGQFPFAPPVQTLLFDEHAAARVELRARATPSTGLGSVVVQADRCEVTAQVASVAPAPAPAPDQRVGSSPLLTVACWSDLALGIDESRRVWAVTPVPEVGEEFPKGRAIELDLAGEQWEVVLRLAATSPDGRTISREELARAFRFLPDPASLGRDHRAKRNADREGQTAGEGLAEQASGVRKQLRGALSDLRRRLKRAVGGPADGGETLLHQERNVVTTGFVVRYLFSDGAPYRFGERPTGR
jgi:hypothetical protein